MEFNGLRFLVTGEVSRPWQGLPEGRLEPLHGLLPHTGQKAERVMLWSVCPTRSDMTLMGTATAVGSGCPDSAYPCG